MPFPLLHLAIADRMEENKNDRDQYLIGSISPDAIHCRKNSTREDKRKIHFIKEKTIEGRFSDIEKFKKDMSDYGNKSFLNGYINHVVVDFLWLHLVNWHYKYKYRREIQEDKRSEIYYGENRYLENELFCKNSEKYNRIFSIIELSRTADFIDFLSGKEIGMWRNKIIHDGYSNTEMKVLGYFSNEMISSFIEISIEILNECNRIGLVSGFDHMKKKYCEDYLAPGGAIWQSFQS